MKALRGSATPPNRKATPDAVAESDPTPRKGKPRKPTDTTGRTSKEPTADDLLELLELLVWVAILFEILKGVSRETE